MKKILAAVLASMMILALAGCGKTGLENNWVESDENITATEKEDGSFLYEGRMGSNMKTYWFDYSIDDAYYTTDEIGGYIPEEGNEFVVVKITMKNTFGQTVPMNLWDYILKWGNDEEDKHMNEFSYPIDASEPVLEDQFPNMYELDDKETRTGTLVFVAPEGTEDFRIGFVETFENDTEGNEFWVFFTADEK